MLVVDDDADVRDSLRRALGYAGYEVATAVNGAEAVWMLRTTEYDAVLMDVQMPVMDGWEATRIIRREINPDMPVIALTASAFKGEDIRCLEAGMNAFVPKPFEEQQLINTLVLWLKRRSDRARCAGLK